MTLTNKQLKILEWLGENKGEPYYNPHIIHGWRTSWEITDIGKMLGYHSRYIYENAVKHMKELVERCIDRATPYNSGGLVATRFIDGVPYYKITQAGIDYLEERK